MPVVSVAKSRLLDALGRQYTDEEFQDLCFEYGIELDDVTTEKEMLSKELNKDLSEAQVEASEEVLYKIDIPANRYDMLCLEGIARALNIYRGTTPMPNYRLADMRGKPLQRMVVKPETALIRPFVVCAILRGVTLDPHRYQSFIDLQDKLHQNLCRHRSLVAIGTHDLSTLQGPFTYEALPPNEIQFVPLKMTEEHPARDLLDLYLNSDNKLKKYVPLIYDSLVYPVIYDSQRVVLSLPPIINGQHSAISTSTRDIFIECTATDLTKANIVLNTMVCMFSEYCDEPFEVEPVEVVNALGETHVYPELASRRTEVDAQYVNGSLGLDLSAEQVASLLTKMQLASSASEDGQSIQVMVPPTRSDVLHACDIMEDVAIAYGYNNIPRRVPSIYTQGKEYPLNQLSELLRQEVAMVGFTEVLTWALLSRAEVFDYLRREDDGGTVVEIGNPATAEFEVCRPTLMGSALKTLGANKDSPLPIRLFEISDVVLLSDEREVGAMNQRHLVAVYCNKESGFEVIHGLLNRVMEVLGLDYEGDKNAAVKKPVGSYSWKPSSEPTFFPGRQAKVYVGEREVGIFGIIHPEVLQYYEISYPVSALELNLEAFALG